MIIPVILSGGSGSRLWPLSRKLNPKQFLPMVSEHSLLQDTLLRIVSKYSSTPAIVCNDAHRFLVAEHMRQINIENPHIILEPEGRNTAPAIAIAAMHLAKHYDNPTLLVLPADHVIGNKSAFHQMIEQGEKLAADNYLVTFGIVPNKPETGYGYIRKASEIAKTKAYQVECFVEKPDQLTAQQYLESGEYLWNSGMFMFKCSSILNELQQFQPEVCQSAEQALQDTAQDMDFVRLDKQAFLQSPSISIDYAVMEKTKNAAILPLDAQWSDIGAWDALWEVSQKDSNNNVCSGDVLCEQTNNSYIHADDKLVATIGMQDCIVVETADAVLVANKNKAQDVKAIVEKLHLQQRDEALLHQMVYRPWGSYETLIEDKRFKVKRIIVKPNASLSLQKHHHRAEHWIIVHGSAEITKDEETFALTEDQSTYIPVGTKHRLTNPGVIPLEIIEIQSGSYLGEDDIVRYDDHYGRIE